MSAHIDTPVGWVLPFTIADQVALDGMDAEQRALVERYVRHSGGIGADAPGEGSSVDEGYAAGFNDGVEWAGDNIEVMSPSRRDIERAAEWRGRRIGAR